MSLKKAAVASPTLEKAASQPATKEKRHPFFVSCARNLERLLLEELRDLGVAGGKAEYLGVTVPLSREEVYRVVYGSRLASRVLRPLATFSSRTPEALYEKAYAFNWSAVLKPEQTLKVTATVSDSAITHSQFAALKLKDAVVDSLRDRHGARPNIDREDPDIRLDLFLRKDEATVSLYYSDGVLHRRGYRKQAVEAPIKENLAAAILRFAGWKGEGRLYDFFCGSGTFLIEAAMIATHTPPGAFRKSQGFESLPDFSPDAWEKVKSEMDGQIAPLTPGLLFGYDIDARAMAATRANLEGTPFASAIKITQKDFNRLEGPFRDAVIVSNPPYGIRLGEAEGALHTLYENLGRLLKTKCPDSRACLVIPHPELEKDIWFKPEKHLDLDNGGLEVRANLYAIRDEGKAPPAKRAKKEKARA
jgi:putative N6-adenine-specific DNA methylase